MSIHSLNVHDQLSSAARSLNLGLSFYLHAFFRCASTEGSGESVQRHVQSTDSPEFLLLTYIWASTREHLSSGVCEQQSRRPACASAQFDHRLCFSFIGKYHI